MKILNYQGNKNRLLPFIQENGRSYIQKGKAILDIFSGGGAVCSSLIGKYKVFSNDLEPFSYHIANSLIRKSSFSNFDDDFETKFRKDFTNNRLLLSNKMKSFIDKERETIEAKEEAKILSFYNHVPTLWNGGFSPILDTNISSNTIRLRPHNVFYSLFTLIYSASYFGVEQAIEIDSLRYAIEMCDKSYNKSFLLSCLFYSMNCCVFSKDGHMAQPLSIEKNIARVCKRRSVSIISKFLSEFNTYKDLEEPISRENIAYNKDFLDLLKTENLSEVGLIYADPPYTDMQYSRYYHLLNTVCEYRFAEPSMINGKYSHGLYLQNRRQSEISTKRTFLSSLNVLFSFCKSNKINLIISFGYPEKNSEEKSDRYLTSIDELLSNARACFGNKNVILKGEKYNHSNQRNSHKKSVVEYLILCRGEDINA